ncbi:14085_t:CDS:1, partial [Funneliformis geosporum]
MSKNSASGRLIHIIVEPNFRKYKFCFALSFVSDSLINAYKRYHHSSVRDFLQSSYSELKASRLRGNLCKDYVY